MASVQVNAGTVYKSTGTINKLTGSGTIALTDDIYLRLADAGSFDGHIGVAKNTIHSNDFSTFAPNDLPFFGNNVDLGDYNDDTQFTFKGTSYGIRFLLSGDNILNLDGAEIGAARNDATGNFTSAINSATQSTRVNILGDSTVDSLSFRGTLDLNANTLTIDSDEVVASSLGYDDNEGIHDGILIGDEESVLRKEGRSSILLELDEAEDFDGAIEIAGGTATITKAVLADDNTLTITKDSDTPEITGTVVLKTYDHVGAIKGDAGVLQFGEVRSATLITPSDESNKPANDVIIPIVPIPLYSLTIGSSTKDLGVNTFGGVISGYGHIHFTGKHNTTILTGNKRLFGAITIDAGKVLVNGSTARAEFIVNTGGTLGGTGTVGQVVVASGGKLAAGSTSVGTLATGNVSLAAGSELVVELDGSRADLIDAEGKVTLEGGAMRVANTGAATVTPGLTWTVIDASGGVVGTFGSVTTDYAFYTPTAIYEPTAVKLTMTRNATAPTDVAVTDNQKATAEWIESLPPSSDVATAVMGLPTDQVQDAYDNLSGEVHADVQGRNVQGANNVGNAALDHISQTTGGQGGDTNQPAAEEEEDSTLNVSTRGLGDIFGQGKPKFWGKVSGSHSQQSRSDGFAASSANTFGLTGGMDLPSEGAWRMGAVVGAGRTNTGMTDRSSDASTNSVALGLYTGRDLGNFGLGFGLLHDISRTDATRQVSVGALNQTLTSAYTTNTTLAFAEVNTKITTNFGSLTPFLRLSHAQTKSGAFTETGGSAALTRAAQTSDVTLAKVGLRGAADTKIAGKAARISGGISYQSVVAGGFGTSVHGFAVGGDTASVGAGVGAGDVYGLDLGLSVKLTPATDLDITYNGTRAKGVDNHTIGATLSVRF